MLDPNQDVLERSDPDSGLLVWISNKAVNTTVKPYINVLVIFSICICIQNAEFEFSTVTPVQNWYSVNVTIFSLGVYYVLYGDMSSDQFLRVQIATTANLSVYSSGRPFVRVCQKCLQKFSQLVHCMYNVQVVPTRIPCLYFPKKGFY